MKFGERLKTLRSEANETQESISKILHVSRQTISNWENERSYPDIEMLIKLSDYYNISLDQLLKEDVIMQDKVISDAKKKRRYRNILFIGIAVILLFTVINLIWLSGIWSQNKYLAENWKVESVKMPEMENYTGPTESSIYVKEKGNVNLIVSKESAGSLIRNDYLNFRRNTTISGSYLREIDGKEDIINTIYFDNETFLVYIPLERFMEQPLVKVDSDFELTSDGEPVPMYAPITTLIDEKLIDEANAFLEKNKAELSEIRTLSEEEYKHIN